MINLILASQSPRRRQLLQLLNMPFTCQVANVDEESITDPDPAVNVVETARMKAHAIANKYLHKVWGAEKSTWIIAADTTVALGSRMLNKPKDAQDARSMLQSLRNRAHEVHTGVVLLNPVTDPSPMNEPIKPPRKAPAIPMSIVIKMPPGSSPGISHFASTPTIKPINIHEITPMFVLQKGRLILIAASYRVPLWQYQLSAATKTTLV